jgi:hypothetical protein
MAKGDGCQPINSTFEVREMRSAETCLAIIRTRGERRLPIDDLYRQLFNPAFYLQAYRRIYRNDGAMTPGTTPEAVARCQRCRRSRGRLIVLVYELPPGA